MSRILVGPFNRVEGDLEITLDIADGRVDSAKVNSTMYRGFEQILRGKNPLDALVYTPRICGICSVSQSVACAYALADAMQMGMPRNGELCTNLILANENMADLLTHFYLFFMPDFARPVYAAQPWYETVERRYRAASGEAAREMLPARAEFLHLMGLLAGKWPHSLSIQPGGSAKPVEAHDRLKMLAILAGFRRFLERRLFGDTLETISQLNSVAELSQWAAQKPWQSSDLRTFLHLSLQLQLDQLGATTVPFMSYGNYPLEGERLFRPGVIDAQGTRTPLDSNQITEDLSHAWLTGQDRPQHPEQGVTQPSLENQQGYSWCKAPRLDGQVMETGALARQLNNGHPLMMDLAARSGANVHNRILARLLELAIVVPQMERWARQIDPSERFCLHSAMPDSAVGVGMVEAARGSLGHWIGVEKGRISNYQIIAPTTWNFSPRDSQGVPGALEQALQGTPLPDGEKDPVSVQHIVRSFDPCMVCTVH
ncbi:nickel-dependent hydrogenase large subunit [Amphritea pacifica]|uniref:Nickel-dependent hydrogenase large subunit n=1 Tax=Amphritea pacifica TaxID=2811233 RepID=A0ABS2W6V9_9GAMM|nr:nickel-dependent hydrogenase large subunit [Amphritea pacifica]MBN0987371.1 nickel-dependent hydrogenase large subunit [Amphritea pacifica]